jgi:hypothetical protein
MIGGWAVIIGGLVLVGKCVAGGGDGDAQPAAKPKCETDLDCRIVANTEAISASCPDAERGKRHVAEREYDLARGIRTGSMSAAEVRDAAARLEATRQYTADYVAKCEAALQEGYKLGDEAVRVVKAREKAEAAAARKAAQAQAAASRPTPSPTAKRKAAPKASTAPTTPTPPPAPKVEKDALAVPEGYRARP